MRQSKIQNLIVFMMLFSLAVLLGTATVDAVDPIRIKPDGSVEGTKSIRNEGGTYVLTADIDNPLGIIVERDSIIIDGAGNTLQSEGTGNGIEIMYRSNVTVKNIRVVGFEYGIILDGSINCGVSQSTLESNGFGGILVYRSTGAILEGNTIVKNGDSGVQIERTSGITFIGNDINANRVGVWANEAENCTFFGNSISNNEFYGVMLTQTAFSAGNLFYANNLVNNFQQVSTSGHVNAWDNGTHGNYWSDADLFDSNGDGISENPYGIDENNTDLRPLMVQFKIPEFPATPIQPLFDLSKILTVALFAGAATLIAIVLLKKKSFRFKL